jgi:hypothetical protein
LAAQRDLGVSEGAITNPGREKCGNHRFVRFGDLTKRAFLAFGALRFGGISFGGDVTANTTPAATQKRGRPKYYPGVQCGPKLSTTPRGAFL